MTISNRDGRISNLLKSVENLKAIQPATRNQTTEYSLALADDIWHIKTSAETSDNEDLEDAMEWAIWVSQLKQTQAEQTRRRDATIDDLNNQVANLQDRVQTVETSAEAALTVEERAKEYEEILVAANADVNELKAEVNLLKDSVIAFMNKAPRHVLVTGLWFADAHYCWLSNDQRLAMASASREEAAAHLTKIIWEGKAEEIKDLMNGMIQALAQVKCSD